MPEIRVTGGQPLETALKKFKRQCQQAGILSEVKKRTYFEENEADGARTVSSLFAGALKGRS
jgi:ribosomal protein S21